MKLSLSKRIIGAVIISVIIGSTAALISSVILMRSFSEQTQKDVEQFSTAVQGQLDAIKEKCREAAYQFAARPDVAEAVKRGDTAYIQKVAREFLTSGTVNVLTIADKDGKVVGRGHSDKVGDSVLNQANVKKALTGQASSGVEEGTVVKFSMRAGHPSSWRARSSGPSRPGIDLSSDTRFVDRVKETMGLECTIFHGDTRVSTTIVQRGQARRRHQDGQPARASKPCCSRARHFQSLNQILGQEYNTAYWPLRDLEGKIAGMLFIGKDRECRSEGPRPTCTSSSAIVVMGIVALMAVAAFFIARSIAGPHPARQRRSGGRHRPRRERLGSGVRFEPGRSPTAPRSRPRPSRKPPPRSRRWPP